MTDAQFSKIMDALHLIEIALYQISSELGFLISCIIAYVILYAIWYALVRFTWF